MIGSPEKLILLHVSSAIPPPNPAAFLPCLCRPVEGLKEMVDHYVKGTQVRQLLFCPNSMCAGYASEVWDPIWHGYDDPEAAKKAGAHK